MEAKETSYKASLKGSLDSTKSKFRTVVLKASKSIDEREKPSNDRLERFIVPEDDNPESKTMQMDGKSGKHERCNEIKESKQDSNGRARSLGFQSIRVGLSRNEYQEMVSKSPFKPAYVIINERIQLQQQLQQQGLASITSNNVSVAAMLQTLPSISEDSNAIRKSTEFKEEPDLKSQTFTLTASNVSQDVYDGEDDEEPDDEEYADEEFATSPSSCSRRRKSHDPEDIITEDEYDEFKDVPVHVMKLSDPIYSEIQSEDLINRRFNWNGGRKDFSEFELMNPSISGSGAVSSSSLLSLPSSPDGKERVTRIRQTMLRGAPSSTPGNNKFNRKQSTTPANHHLPVSADYIPGFDSEDNDTHLSIFQNYSGLLYKDPTSLGAWKDLNLPTKVKYHNTAFSSAKKALHAGKMMNSYRPWGPDRPVDPLDQLLEKQMAAKLGHNSHHSSSHASSGVEEEEGNDWEEEYEIEEDEELASTTRQRQKVRFGSNNNSVASSSSHRSGGNNRPGASHAQRNGRDRQESPLGRTTRRRGGERSGRGGGRDKSLDGIHPESSHESGGVRSSSSPARKSRGNSRSRTPQGGQDSANAGVASANIPSPPKPRTTLIINHVPRPA
jgi:hypothetical protein